MPSARRLAPIALGLAACASSEQRAFTPGDGSVIDAPTHDAPREIALDAAVAPDDTTPTAQDVSVDRAADTVAPDVPDAPLAPRPIAPESTGFVASRRPTLRWTLGARFDHAEVELCVDRACARVLATLRGERSARPTEDLPPGPVFWRLRGVRGAEIARETSATWMFIVGARSAPTGTGWSGVFDVNGDGLGDLAVGAPHSMSGMVQVFHGAPTGMTPGVTLNPADGGVNFGQEIANAGDLNGDGYADLAVGSTGSSMPGTDTPGAVRVYLGGPTGLSSTPVRVLRGGYDDEHLGWSIAGVGDLDGDGYADLVVSAQRLAATALVEARIFRGRSDGLDATPMQLLTCGEHIGTEGVSMAGIGDVNGDGTPDMAVGVGHISDTDPGEVTVFLGGSWAPTLLRGGSNESFGRLVRGAGDVNGDGYADLVVSSPYANARAGSVFVYAGGATGISTTPLRTLDDPSDTAFGLGLAGVGDIDGDGFSDLLAGAGSSSRAQVFYGVTDVTARSALLGAVQGTLGALVGLGDVDGDGHADVATASEQPDGVGVVTIDTGLGGVKSATRSLAVGLGLEMTLAGLR